MAWDWEDRDQRLITRQRLVHSSADEVFRALESYGQHFCRRSTFFDRDEELECALAARNDPLVNLGLAQNASSSEVLADLYQRSAQGTGDAVQDRAVRLACLSNRIAPGMLFSLDALPGIDRTEMRRIALEGDLDEAKILFGNPSCRALFRDLYEGKPPLNDLPPERMLLLVQCSVGNEGINRDDSDADGPDLTAWDVQRGVLHLVRTAPLEPLWVRTLHSLLLYVDPARTRSPQSLQEAREAVDRWKGLKVPQAYKPEAGDEQGDYTQLSLIEEFRCLVAALYGRAFVDEKFAYIGSLQDEDIAMRCVAYARTKLTVEQMQQGRQRDEFAFVLAALFNSELLLDGKCRATLEGMISRDFEYLYKRRCEQMKREYKWFDPAPVSEDLDEAAEKPQPVDLASVRALATELASLKAMVTLSTKQVFWGLIILGILLLWRH